MRQSLREHPSKLTTMAVRTTLRALLTTFILVSACAAQNSTPDAKKPCTSNCPPPAADTTKPSTAQKFPYPGEANSSSSSSSSSNPDATSPDPAAAPSPDDDSPPEPKSTRRKLPKVKQLQSPEDREAEDLYVARFYRDAGNLEGAYLRSKDAVKYQPDDPDAHLLLAEIARKLNKRDEAIAEFNAILKLDASPEQLKTARKALTQLR
jgi:tetratricopeptide (TPR) repeat protein